MPVKWPSWWDWELDFSSELPDRMQERGFTETDLRRMLHDATDWWPDKEEGRFAIRSGWEARDWEIIVEPVPEDRRLVIITAFRLRY
jgi:hypothetical protein